jgi:hypothetical protein
MLITKQPSRKKLLIVMCYCLSEKTLIVFMLLGKLMPNAMFTNENKALRIILLLTEKHFYVLINSEVLLLFCKHLYEKQF